MLYMNYLQKINNKVIPYCVFFTHVLKYLHKLTQKSNVLHINRKGYAKENKKIYRFGMQGWP